LLQAIPGVELVEMADNRENALCCGGGGNLEAVNPELAATIASRRLAQAVETGARTLITPCQQCKRTLANAARREKVRLKVLDLNEYLWRAVGA
jgi:heterodisulfide reductase subunit D